MATPDPQSQRLAKTVLNHRAQLYSSRDAAATAAGISKDTWQRVEEGRRVQKASYAKIDRALGWAVGSCLLVLEGREPVLADSVAMAPQADVPRLTEDAVRKAALEAATASRLSAPFGEVQDFIDELVEVLHKTGEIRNAD